MSSFAWNPQKLAIHGQQESVARNDLQETPNFTMIGLEEQSSKMQLSKARFERVFVCLK